MKCAPFDLVQFPECTALITRKSAGRLNFGARAGLIGWRNPSLDARFPRWRGAKTRKFAARSWSRPRARAWVAPQRPLAFNTGNDFCPLEIFLSVF